MTPTALNRQPGSGVTGAEIRCGMASQLCVISVRLCITESGSIYRPKRALGALRMTGRRILTVVGMAAALVMIASTGTSWAHPGHGHRHVHGQIHVKACEQRVHATCSSTPAARAARTTTTRNATTAEPSYRKANQRGNAFGRTHTDLASHPGKALGLFKHADRPPTRTHQPQKSPPSGPTGSGGEPVSTPTLQQPTQPGSTTATGNQSTPPPASGPPPSAPPSEQPPIARGPAGLAQVLVHSNPARFTALPIVVVSVLALGVCCLIGLARHRA